MSKLLLPLIERYLLDVGPYFEHGQLRWRAQLRLNASGCPCHAAFGSSFGDTILEAVYLRLKRALEKCVESSRTKMLLPAESRWVEQLGRDVRALAKPPKLKGAVRDRDT